MTTAFLYRCAPAAWPCLLPAAAACGPRVERSAQAERFLRIAAEIGEESTPGPMARVEP